MSKILIITGDMNDGDSTTSESDWPDTELSKDDLLLVVKALKKHDGSWVNAEWAKEEDDPFIVYGNDLSEEIISIFGELVPFGIHTITEIKIVELIEQLY